MFYNAQENKHINEGQQFTLGDVTYPSNWLNQATPEEKLVLGLVEVVTANQPADREFYWVDEQLVGDKLTYTNVAKDLVQVKATATESINARVNSMLAPSDYIDVRNLRDATYKPEWIAWRDSVRAYGIARKLDITNALTVDAVAAVMSSLVFPNDPNFVVVIV